MSEQAPKINDPEMIAAEAEARRELVREGDQIDAAENWLYAQHVNDAILWRIADATDDEWDAAFVATGVAGSVSSRAAKEDTK